MILTHWVTRPSSQPQAYRELLCNGSTLSLLLPPTVVESNLMRSPETSYASSPAVSCSSSPLSSSLLTEGDSGDTTMLGEQQLRLPSYQRQGGGLSQKEQMVYVWYLEFTIG